MLNVTLERQLAYDINEWHIDNLTNKSNDYHAVVQPDGRLVVVSCYPNEPQIVTYDMWEKSIEQLKINDLEEVLREFEDDQLEFRDIDVRELAEYLWENGIGKIKQD